jgi:hypothetical protein
MILSYGDKKDGCAGAKKHIGHLSMARASLLGCKDDHLCSFESSQTVTKKRLVATFVSLACLFLAAQTKNRRPITL